jgi:hypothetical protein
LNCPPISAAASNSVTAWPASAAVVAQARPAGPAPTTAIRFLARRRLHDDQRFVAGPRIDEARRNLAREDLVEARLVAGDACIDLVARPEAALLTNSASARNGRAIDTMSPSPRASSASATAGSLMRLVAINGIATSLLSRPRDPRECRARHHRRDRRHARLVPPDAGVDDRGARRLDRLGQRHDLVPRAAAVDEIEHRQPENDDEVSTDRLAVRRTISTGKRDPVLERSSPVVGAMVGARARRTR